jgi:hypothetical protein
MAELGASAALAGLIFVGVSINMAKILSFPTLAQRAAQAITVLLVVLIVSSFYLVPGQSYQLLGAETLVTGGVAWVSNSRIDVISVKKLDNRYRAPTIINILLSQAAGILYVAGGAATIALGGDGLYLLVPAVVLSFVKAITDAWLLLVEINR